MASSGIKKSWETMLRFFRDKEWRQAAVGEALSTVVPHVESMINKRTGAGLTGAEQEQNAFNSHEAALQRDWSAQEAERARDWQEEMYAKYNSLSGKIAQAEQAGVNPMLAVTGNAVSPMSASAGPPSGSSASSGGFASRSFTDLVGTVLGLVKAKSEINVDNALADKYRNEATGQQITNENLRDMQISDIMSKLSQVDLNEANVQLIASKILNTDSDTKLKESQISQIASQIANTEADTNVKIKQLDVMTAEIIRSSKSLDVMEAEISSMLSGIKVDNAQIAKFRAEVNSLKQEFGHKAIMNKFEEIIASEKAGTASIWDTSNADPLTRGVAEAVKFLRSCLASLK